ncbi:hypothetical protein [Nostoc sp. PA-18-2419]|uniref:hypothetical protein n=1 Tax=Nostoc sp. PA-18-2419 TaxID=2575443 RepID=UPI001CB9A5F0|nr:hypothetical protein [Nostoc sp. PA-18-2419]
MKEFNVNNLITYLCIGLAGLIFTTKYYPQNQIAVADSKALASQRASDQSKTIIKNNTESDTTDNSEGLASLRASEVDDSDISILQQNRPLRMTLSVESPSFLKVKVGQEIRQGDIITDNSLERTRLEKQKKSVTLQIDNLKNKAIPKPFEPKQPVGLKQLPRAIFSEESAAIAQSQMKLSQAEAVLEARTQLLKTDNPERRAESENAEAGFQIASQKVAEQEQLIQSMKDMKLSTEILQHEEAKLKQLRSELDQANSALEQSKAKLNASAINQQQELQQLQMNVRLAQSELELANSRLVAAQNRRNLLEYDASLNEARQRQQETQTQQEYSRQQQQYAQDIRDRDYQLAQLNISLTTIEDKLALIPMIRSPRNGYIKRIKPWVGKDGKYTTVVTITAPAVSSKNGGGERSTVSSPNPSSKAKP